MKQIFTFLFLAFFAITNAQDIPSFTYDNYYSYPNDTASLGTVFNPNTMCCLYQGQYQVNAQNQTAIQALAQGGGSAMAEIYVPPYVSEIVFSVDDPVLAAGNPGIRMAFLGEDVLGSTAPTNYTQGDIAESDWKFIYSANRNSMRTTRNPNFATDKSMLRVAIYNGLNYGYGTLTDYNGQIGLSDIDITYLINQEDSLDYVNWANGTTTGVEKINSQSEIQIYPNPATNNIQLIISNEQLGKEVQILDITGKTVKTVIVNLALSEVEGKEKQSLTIDISNLQNGVYFVKLGNTVQKLIKE